jgi:hypothetical protein
LFDITPLGPRGAAGGAPGRDIAQTVTGEPGAERVERADGTTTEDAVSGKALNIGTAP